MAESRRLAIIKSRSHRLLMLIGAMELRKKQCNQLKTVNRQKYCQISTAG
jgi:hypothetical protein